jgi:hypothetical protein
MSSPFSVQNTGYLGFWVEDARCFATKVVIGNVVLNNVGWDSVAYQDHYLDRANSTTMFCKVTHGTQIPSEADVEVVVDYKPWHSFPMKFRKIYRFVGRYGDRWEWTAEEPSAN